MKPKYTQAQLKAASQSGLRYMPSYGEFRNYNHAATFDPERVHGRSYGWWAACVTVGPFVVFNACYYSNQTAKHLSRMRSVMAALGIKIDFDLYSHGGLDCLTGDSTTAPSWRSSSGPVEHYAHVIAELREAMAVPGSHRAKNEERVLLIDEAQINLDISRKLIALGKASGAKRTGLIKQLRTLKTQLAKAEATIERLRTKHVAIKQRRKAIRTVLTDFNLVRAE